MPGIDDLDLFGGDHRGPHRGHLPFGRHSGRIDDEGIEGDDVRVFAPARERPLTAEPEPAIGDDGLTARKQASCMDHIWTPSVDLVVGLRRPTT
jgi:hypothetical protein